MPEILEEYDFNATGRYPWDEWLDGQIRKLTRGTDFTAKSTSMVASARKAAQTRNMEVLHKVDGDSLILKAIAK